MSNGYGRTLLLVGMSLLFCASALGAVTLVRDGVATSTIVLDAKAGEPEKLAAAELQRHLKLASGATVHIVTAPDHEKLPAAMARVIIGRGKLARDHGITTKGLKAEEFLVRTGPNCIVFAGHDHQSAERKGQTTLNMSMATLWAVDHVLDRHLGVRWLWPGEVGTYVPRRRTITLPDLDVRGRPDLVIRRLRAPIAKLATPGKDALLTDEARAKLIAESDLWKYHHRLGRRSTIKFGHAFKDWHKRFAKTRPDLLATRLPGARKTYPPTERVKLCVSNPAVADQMVADWVAAGAGDNWNVCPNDSAGFCICDRCRALDVPPNQPSELVWRAKANLTGRYVDLWNRVLARMKQRNPKATLSSYAYSAYREPPANTKLESGMVLGIVHVYWTRDAWRKWSDAGAMLFLRPNWWHMGGPAPHIPLHAVGDYFRFARKNRMTGFDFDTLLGFWGTQGPNYYLIARLNARSDLTVDDVIAEYCSAFGRAAPIIRQYLAQWEDLTDRAAYAAPAGGVVEQNPKGLYARAVKKHGLSMHPIGSSWSVLPLLYTDAVVARGEALLAKADAAADADPMVRARVAFLRDGLRHLRLTRDVIALGDKKVRTRKVSRELFVKKVAELQALRKALTPRHVVWGEVLNSYEKRRGYATDVKRRQAGSLDGL